MERLVHLLKHGPYPGLTEGRPALYKAFALRFLTLCRAGEALGIVPSSKDIRVERNARVAT